MAQISFTDTFFCFAVVHLLLTLYITKRTKNLADYAVVFFFGIFGVIAVLLSIMVGKMDKNDTK